METTGRDNAQTCQLDLRFWAGISQKNVESKSSFVKWPNSPGLVRNSSFYSREWNFIPYRKTFKYQKKSCKLAGAIYYTLFSRTSRKTCASLSLPLPRLLCSSAPTPSRQPALLLLSHQLARLLLLVVSTRPPSAPSERPLRLSLQHPPCPLSMRST